LRGDRSGGLAAFRRLGSHVVIALDGTEYHRSTRIHCPNCSRRTRKGQPTEHFHTLLCATIVAPGHAQVVPLEPEFIGRRTVTTSRTARAAPCGAGSRGTAPATGG